MCSLANSEDPDEMPQDTAFYQGLHCLVYFVTVEKYLFFHIDTGLIQESLCKIPWTFQGILKRLSYCFQGLKTYEKR